MPEAFATAEPLHPERVTVTGRPFGDQLTEVPVHNPDVIRSPDTALAAEGGVAVLRGNLAPDGAVIKHIAAEPRLIKHTGPAVVFDSYSELQERINDPANARHFWKYRMHLTLEQLIREEAFNAELKDYVHNSGRA